MIILLTKVYSLALSDVIYNKLEEKLPVLSTMVANVSRTFERTKFYIFDIYSKLYISKDDLPLSGKISRRYIFLNGRVNTNAF